MVFFVLPFCPAVGLIVSVMLPDGVETQVLSFAAFCAPEPKSRKAVITAQMMKNMSDATRQPVPFEPVRSFGLRPERETVRLKDGGTGGSIAASLSVSVSGSTEFPQPEQKTALSGKALPHFGQFIFLFPLSLSENKFYLLLIL